jgi:dCMP deaminase
VREHLTDQERASSSSKRLDWDAYFLAIAETVSARADCRRAHHGAVVVSKDRRIVSTGYNGTEPGGKSCLAGECPRGLATHQEIPGQLQGNMDYSTCIALHAEQNAIAYGDHREMMGGTIYIAGGKPPCDLCTKLIAAAGLVRTVWR